jgi:hypothetical protein
MKEFPFNTSADKFVTENTVWFAIADKYKAFFINKTLRTYYRDENHQGLSKCTKKKYPAGFVYYYQEIINRYTKKMYLSFPDTIRLYKNLIKSSILAKIHFTQAIKGLFGWRRRFFAFLCIPLGYLALWLDMRKEKRLNPARQ